MFNSKFNKLFNLILEEINLSNQKMPLEQVLQTYEKAIDKLKSLEFVYDSEYEALYGSRQSSINPYVTKDSFNRTKIEIEKQKQKIAEIKQNYTQYLPLLNDIREQKQWQEWIKDDVNYWKKNRQTVIRKIQFYKEYKVLMKEYENFIKEKTLEYFNVPEDLKKEFKEYLGLSWDENGTMKYMDSDEYHRMRNRLYGQYIEKLHKNTQELFQKYNLKPGGITVYDYGDQYIQHMDALSSLTKKEYLQLMKKQNNHHQINHKYEPFTF